MTLLHCPRCGTDEGITHGDQLVVNITCGACLAVPCEVHDYQYVKTDAGLEEYECRICGAYMTEPSESHGG